MAPVDWSIEGKVVLVTGGAAGVGAGLVRALLAHNASHVAFLDIAEREGAALESELTTKFGALRVKFIKCDISDPVQLHAAYDHVLNKYSRLDAVVNNAAIVNVDKSSYKKMIDINFVATVTSTYKALDVMGADKGKNGGVIVNISSLLALKTSARLPVYAATKTAVLQFSNNIATDEFFTNTQVRIATVCLGPTDTAILHKRSQDNFFANCDQGISSGVTERQRGARRGLNPGLVASKTAAFCHSAISALYTTWPSLLDENRRVKYQVESAVSGILEVISRGSNGSTWIVANDKPAVDITDTVRKGFRYLTENIAELQ